MKTTLAAATLLALSLLGTASADEAPKGDLARLQGMWSADVGPDKDVPIRLTFKGKAVTLAVTLDGKDFEVKGEIELDDAAKPHKTIDWVKFVGPQGDEAPANLGIYEFEDADTVKVCNGGPGNERPAEFKAGEQGPPNLLVLKRDKG